MMRVIGRLHHSIIIILVGAAIFSGGEDDVADVLWPELLLLDGARWTTEEVGRGQLKEEDDNGFCLSGLLVWSSE
jgi:hypothetical protein